MTGQQTTASAIRAAEQRVIGLARATYPELPADLAILIRDALEDLEDAQRQQADNEIQRLHTALQEIRDILEDYVDVTDGGPLGPNPNHAMRAMQIIDEALGEEPKP